MPGTRNAVLNRGTDKALLSRSFHSSGRKKTINHKQVIVNGSNCYEGYRTLQGAQGCWGRAMMLK